MERVMEEATLATAEGRIPLAEALGREESLWGHQSAVVIVTPSPHVEWVLAANELSKRRVRVVAVVVDASSFGGPQSSQKVLVELAEAGIPTYLVRQGDRIPDAFGALYLGSRFPEPEPEPEPILTTSSDS